MKVHKHAKPAVIVLAAALVGYAAIAIAPKIASMLPRVGHVLDFTITKTSDDGPERAQFVEADVSPTAGTLDDFAATAVAIASALPGNKVIVNIERGDVAATFDRWRRTLARAEFRRSEDPHWHVSTVDPLLPTNEISASNEYSSRAGLALTNDGELLSAAADAALVKEIAASHGIGADRVTVITTLRHEQGDRSDWITLSGPGSEHVEKLARCYADKTNGADGWKNCR